MMNNSIGKHLGQKFVFLMLFKVSQNNWLLLSIPFYWMKFIYPQIFMLKESFRKIFLLLEMFHCLAEHLHFNQKAASLSSNFSLCTCKQVEACTAAKSHLRGKVAFWACECQKYDYNWNLNNLYRAFGVRFSSFQALEKFIMFFGKKTRWVRYELNLLALISLQVIIFWFFFQHTNFAHIPKRIIQ